MNRLIASSSCIAVTVHIAAWNLAVCLWQLDSQQSLYAYICASIAAWHRAVCPDSLTPCSSCISTVWQYSSLTIVQFVYDSLTAWELGAARHIAACPWLFWLVLAWDCSPGAGPGRSRRRWRSCSPARTKQHYCIDKPALVHGQNSISVRTKQH